MSMGRSDIQDYIQVRQEFYEDRGTNNGVLFKVGHIILSRT